MPWTNQTGGGGNGGDGPGPWGQPPRRPNGNRPGGPQNQPPDLEEIIRRGQDRLRNTFGGGRPGSGGGAGIPKGVLALIGVALVVLYLFQAAFTVQENQRGVILTFGQPSDEVAQPGLNFVFWPFQTVEMVNINEQRINIGGAGRTDQGLMLSGDQNIVDVQFAVLYRIDDPIQYLFEVADPDELVRQVAEASMREIVGRRPAQDVFRDARVEIAQQVREQTQRILNESDVGVAVSQIAIEEAAPPEQVADAFEEVQRAEQNEDQFVEEANRDANRVLGAARGQAAQIREEAQAYANRVVQEAEGEAQRFLSVYEQYRQAPEVTRKRLFLETMEEVLGASDKVIIEGDAGGGSGVVPYLPLDQLQNGRTGQQTSQNLTQRQGVQQ